MELGAKMKAGQTQARQPQATSTELAEYRRWREFATQDADVAAELAAIEHQPGEIQDRFYRPLSFGTGGLRGVLGAGPNRMNVHVVARASAGLSLYLRGQHAKPSVAIGYDTRVKSALFAQTAAEVFASHGLAAHLFSVPMPTPALSFAVRALSCQAGVVITASHNPARYNGYKVYGPDGCQITDQAAAEITEAIAKVDYFAAIHPDFINPDGGMTSTLQTGSIHAIPAAVEQAFYSAELAQRLQAVPERALKIVYTPLNGAGLVPVTTVLAQAGYADVTVVESQRAPDGAFPTCPFPNPELPQTLEEGLKVCHATGADLLLATDPDCDRLGVAVRTADAETSAEPAFLAYRRLSGNEVGVLLLDYICKMRAQNNAMPERALVVKTIVTAPMAKAVAARWGVQLVEVLTGFKYIGEVIGHLEAAGEKQRFLFGFEESCGYLSGTHVRDKDAVNACLLLCDMAAHHKARGLTLYDAMQELYHTYGFFAESLRSFSFPGQAGQQQMSALMRHLRQSPPAAIGGDEVEQVLDYLCSSGGDGAAKAGADLSGGAQRVTGQLAGQPSQNIPGLPSSDVLQFALAGSGLITVRPSGTEPTVKAYCAARGASAEESFLQLRRYEEAIENIVGAAKST